MEFVSIVAFGLILGAVRRNWVWRSDAVAVVFGILLWVFFYAANFRIARDQEAEGFAVIAAALLTGWLLGIIARASIERLTAKRP